MQNWSLGYSRSSPHRPAMPEAKNENAEEADLSHLFTTVDGEDRRRLNFYIQPRLEPNLHAWLFDAIKHSGGRIANEHREVFPRRGYILIDPTSRRGKDLIHSKPNDPSKPIWVVSWTFITGCLEAKRLLDPEAFARTSPVFLEPGYARLLKVFIHRSTPREARSNLATKIANHGGIIVDKKKDARVIICSPTSPKLLELRKLYPNSSEKAIESPLWVDECLKAGEIEFTQRRGGREP
ncbi:hypothetical protein BS47DRAFT_236570 [Hydnum rufescens UP504]|uniref:BRCT domain-containing protein n=1 Tax=Hydnum rufescens UP504 TaxID=1448309 RepID=A0A9P6AM54_9AGAM|nr:hypothetical protein BS47DRAFT_236570 [Hydnum rufescens UP504]